MSHIPPYHLDPHLVVRNPEAVPLLMRRGMVNVIERATEGSLHDKVMKAFNVIAFRLTETKRIKKGSLTLTSVGNKREKQVSAGKEFQVTKAKMLKLTRWLDRLRKHDPDLYARSWWDRGAPDDGA